MTSILVAKGGLIMDRETILAKAKNSKNEEYENSIVNNLIKRNTIFLVVICIVLFFIRVIHADIRNLEIVTNSEALVIMCGVSSFNILSLYGELKERKNLYIGLVLLIFFIISLVGLILRLFG